MTTKKIVQWYGDIVRECGDHSINLVWDYCPNEYSGRAVTPTLEHKIPSVQRPTFLEDKTVMLPPHP